MFDKKIIDEYKKILPSDNLRMRVSALDMSPAARNAAHRHLIRIQTRYITSAAACLTVLLISAIILIFGKGMNPGSISLSDGSMLGANDTQLFPETVEYAAVSSISLFEAPSKARSVSETDISDVCFAFTANTGRHGAMTVTVDSGVLLVFDEDVQNYISNGMFTVFSEQTDFYWCLPKSDITETFVMRLKNSDMDSKVELVYNKESKTYTARYSNY